MNVEIGGQPVLVVTKNIASKSSRAAENEFACPAENEFACSHSVVGASH